MSYNSTTGTLSAGQRGVASNAYTGQYAAGSRAATTTASGKTVVAGRGVTGNAYSGTATDTRYVRGEQGGVAKQGNDTYVGYGDNLYKKSSDGGWSEYDKDDGGWNDVSQSQIDQAQQQAQQQAQERAQQAPQEQAARQEQDPERTPSAASGDAGDSSRGSFSQGSFGSNGGGGGGFTRDGTAGLDDAFNARSEGQLRTSNFRAAGGFGGFRGRVGGFRR
jgi:hypothetical protein